jgi:biopolymer transport protein ExbD
VRFPRFQHLRGSSQGEVGKVNVTPMIDVIMVLIIFYLIVGKLAVDQSARVQLPAAFAGLSETQRGITLAVLPQSDAPVAPGTPEEPPLVLLEGQPITLSALADALRIRMPELAEGKQVVPLHLRADKRLTYGAVQPVIEACRAAGITSIKLVASRDAQLGALQIENAQRATMGISPGSAPSPSTSGGTP